MDGFVAGYVYILTLYYQYLTPLRLGYALSSDKAKVCNLVVVNAINIHNLISFSDEQFIATCIPLFAPLS